MALILGKPNADAFNAAGHHMLSLGQHVNGHGGGSINDTPNKELGALALPHSLTARCE